MPSSAGKGMDPVKGYNFKKWYAHFDEIVWEKNSNKNIKTNNLLKKKTKTNV